jgi:hypothetical protein
VAGGVRKALYENTNPENHIIDSGIEPSPIQFRNSADRFMVYGA